MYPNISISLGNVVTLTVWRNDSLKYAFFTVSKKGQQRSVYIIFIIASIIKK